MVRFSEILNKISTKHGAKPSAPKALGENEFKKTTIPLPAMPPHAQDAGIPVLRGEPTQEIGKGIMERLFQSVLAAAPEGGPQAPAQSPFESALGAPAGRGSPIGAPKEIRPFRNHAELMKFASLLIHDVEDALNRR